MSDAAAPLSFPLATPLIHWRQWCARRNAELAGPDSWLGLIALSWLEPGSNRVGSSADCVLVLPGERAHLGDLVWDGADTTRLVWRPAPGSPAVLEGGGGDAPGGGVVVYTDAHEPATTVVIDEYRFFVIARDGRLAVRLRDRNWQGRAPFAGLDYFPFDPVWQVEARWESLDPPVTLAVPSVTGELKAVTVTGRAVFEQDGQRHALLPMETGDAGYFFVFRDQGAGRETYGAGRFLRAAPPRDGRLVLDFNRAYNPPCAFTPFATCPLPPPENWLPFPIPAGEKKYAGHG